MIKEFLKITLLVYFVHLNKVMAQTYDITEYLKDPINLNVQSYLEYSKKMGYNLVQQEGIIFYGLIDEDVPGYVYFIPCHLKEGQSFEELVKEKLSDKQTFLYTVVFSPINWLLPDLSKIVASLQYDLASLTSVLNSKSLSCKVSYCKFTFNIDPYSNPLYTSNGKTTELLINYKGETFRIKEKAFPDENGRSVLFEKMNF